MQTMDRVRENVRVLTDDVAHLEHKLDLLLEYHSQTENLEAESVERILNVKYRLLSEQEEILAHLESESAREGAEARLKFHLDNDTLDLY